MPGHILVVFLQGRVAMGRDNKESFQLLEGTGMGDGA